MKLSELLLADIRRRAGEIDALQKLSELHIVVRIDNSGLVDLRFEHISRRHKLGVVEFAQTTIEFGSRSLDLCRGGGAGDPGAGVAPAFVEMG